MMEVWCASCGMMHAFPECTDQFSDDVVVEVEVSSDGCVPIILLFFVAVFDFIARSG